MGKRGVPHRIDPAVKERLLAEYKTGRAVKDLARKYGISRQSIHTYIREGGVERPSARRLQPTDGVKAGIMAAQGATVTAIAEQTGFSRMAIQKLLSDDEVVTLRKQIRNGIVALGPEALDVYRERLQEFRDPVVAEKVLNAIGGILAAEQSAEGRGGNTFNILALLDPEGAGRVLARFAGDSRPPVLDGELYTDIGRTGQEESIQAIPEEGILQVSEPGVERRRDFVFREVEDGDGVMVNAPSSFAGAPPFAS